ncbi:MAG TPA: hypothetical protein GX738_03735 [Firmicutes bacterium]|nr:hypothetical protein [Bacillota bacterium]
MCWVQNKLQQRVVGCANEERGHSLYVALVAACVAVIHLFWEIAIVYEDLGLQAGLIRGHTIMRSSLGEVARLLITILLTSGIVSLLLTWLAQYYLGCLLAILIWSIIGASLYVAVFIAIAS